MSGQGASLYDAPAPGDTSAPTTAGTKEQFAEFMTNLFWGGGGSYDYVGWGSNTSITFSISSYYSDTEKTGIRDAFATWAEVTNLTFTEVSSGAEISLVGPANSGEQGRAFAAPSAAWNPGSNYTEVVFTSVRIVMDYDSGGFGSDPTDHGNYALTTAIHEIGHALGLGHTGSYNAGSGNPTYDNSAQWTNETRQYSLMSYWSAANSGATHFEYPSTPMLMDIYAIQTLYGENWNTRSGNTVYGFNSTAGRAQFDFSVNDHPVVAIWDGGGTDTIDLSGYSQTQVINLNAGQFSNVGGSTGNLSIAYGAVIENAVGGSGQDTIYGNDVNNSILAGGGNDTIHGSSGNDTIDGQAGTDTVTYTYNIAAFLVSIVNTTTLTLQHIANAWTDTISNIENFIFSGVSYTFAQMQAFDSGLGDIAFSFTNGTGSYTYTSTSASQDTTLTAAGMNYNSGSGNMFAISRTSTALTVDVASASAKNFSIWADTGNDEISITGTHSNIDITFYGKDGDDTLTIASGIVGDDVISLQDGDDTVYASGGNDQIWGGNGNDTVYGEAGNDTVYGGAGNETIYGDNLARSGVSGNDSLSGEAGDDTIYGGDGDDWIWGGADNDTLAGDAGNDTIYGGDGVDQIWGGNGNDTIYGDNLNGDAGDGADTIYGNDGNDVISAGGGADTVYGGNGNDYLYGGAGMDNLQGDAGADYIYGGTDNDTMSGGADNDYLDGEAGDDTIYGNNGDDVIAGGAGIDIIYGDNINRTDTVGNDTIYAGIGADTVYGGDGNDTIYGDLKDANAGDDADILYGDGGNDVIVGNGGADQLYGGTGNDSLWGGTGDDIFEGGAGSDVIQGGDGIDLVIYDNETARVVVDLTAYYGIDGGGGYDTLSSIENVRGSGYNDTIVGSSGANTLWGQGGNDILYGSYGGDTVYGGDGNDIIYGDLQNGTAWDGNDILYGGAGNDTLIGSGGDDTLDGGAGNDTLWGGTGADTFILALGSVDGIWDFNAAQGDKLDFSAILDGYYTNPLTQAITDFIRITTSGNNSVVSVDQNGGGNSFVQVATLYNVTGLTDEAALQSGGNLVV